jgi:tripartite-type tricarboxylate transporter receptor subunit TctC
MARPFMAPPGIPAEQAAILKKAFMDANKDPAYLQEAEKLKIDISPLGGDEVAKIMAKIAKTPPAVVKRYNAILHTQ